MKTTKPTRDRNHLWSGLETDIRHLASRYAIDASLQPDAQLNAIVQSAKRDRDNATAVLAAAKRLAKTYKTTAYHLHVVASAPNYRTPTIESSQSPPVLAALPDKVRDEVIRDLKAGRKLNAVKRYRDARGGGLVDAKNAVDALEVSLTNLIVEPAE